VISGVLRPLLVFACAAAALSAQAPQPPKRLDLLSYLQAGYAGNKANLIAAAEAIIEVDIDPAAGQVIAGNVRLQQVLLNLVSNALDVVGEGEDRRITIAARPLGDQRAEITVTDRGPGVPAAIRERIFDPFFTTKGPSKGLGLGLSISYNIIKDFGGLLAVRAGAAGGAEFVIELDRARVGEPADA